MSDINMTTAGDKNDLYITGLPYLHPNTLLAVDNNNSSIKSVNIWNDTVKSRLSFTSYPWDITSITGDQADVTIPEDQTIQVIATKYQFLCLRSIHVIVNVMEYVQQKKISLFLSNNHP